VDPDDFVDQRVLILGKGNSALETADNLVETAAVIHVAGPHSVRMAWNSIIGPRARSNNNFLDTYQLKSQNACSTGRSSSQVEGDSSRYRVRFSFSAPTRSVRSSYDRVVVCNRFRFDASVFDPSCRPRLVSRPLRPPHPAYDR